MPSRASRETIVPLLRLAASLPGALQALHLYGAAAVAALGWAFGQLAGFDTSPCVPLWFAGMLAIYNVDRLRADPADRLNVPLRLSRHRRLARASLALAACAAVLLLALPLLQGNLPLLAMVLAAALVSLAYSLPSRGRRMKDLPLLKTLLPPAVVEAAFFAPLLLQGRFPDAPFAAGWLFCLLLGNMILCDLRDLPGDAAAGVRSLPVVLGRDRSLRLVALLAMASAPLAILAARDSPLPEAWLALALLTPPGLLLLQHAARAPRSESFYEWWVEGIFLLPPAIVAADRLRLFCQ